MPKQQQKRTQQQSQPSEPARTLPPSAVKYIESISDRGRLAFADVVINEDTFHLFNGLKVCSFVVLKPKERGGPRRIYVPGHKLPNGQNFQHLQEESGNIDPLRQALLAGYEAKFGAGTTPSTNVPDVGSFDEEQVAEKEVPF